MTQQEFLQIALQMASQGATDMYSGMSESDAKSKMKQTADSTGASWYRPETIQQGMLPFDFPHEHLGSDQQSEGSWGKEDYDLYQRLWYQYSSATDEDVKRGAQQDLLNFLQSLNERDYNKAVTADERAYNESIYQKHLADERAYNDPSAELARLMATGMSRDAALQQLSGGASSGAGGAAAGGSAIPSPTMRSAEYNQPAGTSLRNKIGAATDIVQTLVSLANVGINGFSALRQGRLTQAEAVAVEQANAATVAGSKFNAMYQSAVDSGLIDKSKIKSFDDARKAMKSITSEDSLPISWYMQNEYDAFTQTPGALRVAADNFDANYRAGDAIARQRQMFALAAAYELQPQVLMKAMDKDNAVISQIWNEIENDSKRVTMEQAESEASINLMKSQTRHEQAETSNVNKDTEIKELQRRNILIAVQREELTKDTLDQVALFKVGRMLKIAEMESDPKVMDATLDEIANTAEYRRALMSFNAMRMLQGDQMLKGPNGASLAEWSIFFDDLNLGQMYQAKYKNKSPYLMTKEPGFNRSFDNLIRSFGLEPM